MSAQVWEGSASGYAVPSGPDTGRPVRPGRPRLVLVPALTPQRTRSGLRLTRRGRIVLALTVLAAALVLGLAGLPGAGAAPATHTVTVRTGQTLSEIAATELPGLPVSQAVTVIRLANDLNTAQIGPGQRLVIPRS